MIDVEDYDTWYEYELARLAEIPIKPDFEPPIYPRDFNTELLWFIAQLLVEILRGLEGE